ncbi:MAG: hypothetical protein AAF681_01805 [Pseudomonadota bacterium]
MAHDYGYKASNRMADMSTFELVQTDYEHREPDPKVIRRLRQTGDRIHSVHDADGKRISQ